MLIWVLVRLTNMKYALSVPAIKSGQKTGEDKAKGLGMHRRSVRQPHVWLEAFTTAMKESAEAEDAKRGERQRFVVHKLADHSIVHCTGCVLH